MSLRRRADPAAAAAAHPETLRYVPWRFALTLAASAVLLIFIAIAPFWRFVWPFVWIGAYVWSLWETLTIVVDLFDRRASMRQHLRGLGGFVRVIDVWWTRELILSNLLFLIFLMPHGDYGRYIHGLDEFDGTTLDTMKNVLLPAYAGIVAFSADVTLTSATTSYEAHHWLLKLVLTCSGYMRFLNMATVLVLGLAKSNEVEMECELPVCALEKARN